MPRNGATHRERLNSTLKRLNPKESGGRRAAEEFGGLRKKDRPELEVYYEEKYGETGSSQRVSKRKKPKGRQGRSKKVREEQRKRKEQMEQMGYGGQVFLGCTYCSKRDSMLEDLETGDMVCGNCGVVGQTGLMASSQSTMNPPLSKPYQKRVHYQQRIAQLRNIDPRLPKEVVRSVERYVFQNLDSLPSTDVIGIGSFGRILKILGYPSKLASHWIQLRVELFGDKPVEIPTETLKRCSMRYFCIAQAFDLNLEKIRELNQLYKNDKNGLRRKNIINLNYTIVQIFRLESEELFRLVAPYFPHVRSPVQPRLNNQRWRILIDYCEKHYKLACDPVHGDLYSFQWDRGYLEEVWEEMELGENGQWQKTGRERVQRQDLNALTEEDLLNHFNYFQ